MAEVFGFTIEDFEFELHKVIYPLENELRYSGAAFKYGSRYPFRMKKVDGHWKINEPSSDLPTAILKMEAQLHQAIIQNERSENRSGFLGAV